MKKFPLPILLLCTFAARGETRLAAPFTDHAVLQRDQPVPVWGNAAPGAKVSVSFADQTKEAVAASDGRWLIRLDPVEASTNGRVLSVSGGPAISNVVVGDVWLAAGGSNMKFPLRDSEHADQEWNSLPLASIRLLQTGHSTGSAASWAEADRSNAATFSAVAWHFGRTLQRKLRVPVGLIAASAEHSRIEAWMRRETLAETDAGKARLRAWDERSAAPSVDPSQLIRARALWENSAIAARASGRPIPRKPGSLESGPNPNEPAALQGAFIAPLVPYALRGVVWYQGESDTTSLQEAQDYGFLFPALIADWRAQWNQDLPFVFAQLPSLENALFWPWLRASQASALRSPMTAMAVTLDLGSPGSLTPASKQPVGERLALAALKLVHRFDIEASGPVLEKDRTLPPALQLIFRNTGGGLDLHPSDEPVFQIAGADRKFYPAQATVSGETIKLTHPDVPVPVAARYAWSPNPPAVLFGRNGLPASPFRTDDWPAEVP